MRPVVMTTTTTAASGGSRHRLRRHGDARRMPWFGGRPTGSGGGSVSAVRAAAGKGLLFDARFERGFVIAIEIEEIDDVHQFVLARIDGHAEDLMQKIHEIVGELSIKVGDSVLVTLGRRELLMMSRHHAGANA